VTHEDLRALLPAYAAGALDTEVFESVRAHLASGCLLCLQEVYDRPVGLPRTAFREAPEPAPAQPPPEPTPPPPVANPPVPTVRHVGLVAAVVVLGLALAACVTWMIVELQTRLASEQATAARATARLGEAETARAALTARIEALAQAADVAHDAASRETAAEREAHAEVAAELEAAREQIATLTRTLKRREGDLERMRLGLDGRDTLHDLVATPGLDLLRLRPVAPFRDVRAHALWRPGARSLLVYAFGLPTLPTEATYRVRIALDQAQNAERTLTPTPKGEATAAITFDHPPTHIQDIQILLDPPGKQVLAWTPAEWTAPSP
jgi:hypothetical protein